MKSYTFNELSLPFADKWTAQQKIKHFLATCGACRNELKFGDLRVHKNLGKHPHNWLLAENYAVFNWLEDGDTTDADLFLDIITASPLITDADTQNERWIWSDFYYQERILYGLGAAHLLDTLAVSFASHTDWDKSEIEITHIYLDEAADDVVTKYPNVKHGSTIAHVKVHEEYFKVDYKILWEQRAIFLPNLLFQKQVEKQINRWASTNKETMLDTFCLLDKYATEWKTPNDIDKHFSEVSNVGNNRYVFDIKGNNLRLIAIITFQGAIEVRFVGTHAMYDRIDATNI
jgi:mRNA-degrading endonuclease HigB of HigAB toxin-antitoxin module